MKAGLDANTLATVISNSKLNRGMDTPEAKKDNIIYQFYSAFSQLDAESMVDLYHNDILFNDPAFGTFMAIGQSICGECCVIVKKVKTLEFNSLILS